MLLKKEIVCKYVKKFEWIGISLLTLKKIRIVLLWQWT